MILSSDIPHFPPHLRRDYMLRLLSITLAQSKALCRTWAEIRPRIVTIWRDEESELVISRLSKLTLDRSEQSEFTEEVSKLSTDIENMRGIHRSRADRRFVRLVRLMPVEVGSEHALRDLMQTRKIRRQAAVKMLRQIGVQAAHVRKVLGHIKSPVIRSF